MTRIEAQRSRTIMCTTALFFFLLIPWSVLSQTEFIERETTYGTLQGLSVPIPDFTPTVNRRLDVFVGVPYAKPPVADLRWRPTELPEAWSGVRNATEFSPCCVQVMDNIRAWSFGPNYNNTSEDCLYLNIYSPRDLTEPGRLHSVMFWIHGGSYRYGSGEEYDGRILAQEGDVVVITINYRLGVMGFLSTDDNVAPGNFALNDMVYALRWVRDNVQQFGGDPAKVTVFGNSAGGAAVSTLIFSPEAQGLFQAVIAQSGNALSPWAVYRGSNSIRPHTEDLARQLDCPTADSQAMVDCLREKDGWTVVHTPVSSQTEFNAAFAPRLDGLYLTSYPEDLLEQGLFPRVRLLSGTVPDEFADNYVDEPGIELGWSRQEKNQRLWEWSRRYEGFGDVLYSALAQQYDSPGEDLGQQRDLLLEMRTDDGYIAPHTRHALGHSRHADDTYMYSFEHRSQDHETPDWMGVPHAEELYYVFGTPLWNTRDCPWGCHNIVWYNLRDWTTEDELVSNRTMAAWSNFAKFGNPSFPDFDWPRFNGSSESSVAIRGSDWVIQNFHKYSNMRFWNTFRMELYNASIVDCPS